jgi:hypothetical protein
MLFVINFNLYSECLNKEALAGSGDFKIGGQIINTVKCADNLMLLAKEEMVLQLQGMIEKLTECGKNKRNENFKTTISSKTYDRPKTTGECGMF